MEDVGFLTRGVEFDSLLLDRPVIWTGESQVQLRETSSRGRIKLRPWGFSPGAVAVGGSNGGGGDCRICAAAGDLWVRVSGGQGLEFAERVGGFSHESEHDLAVMVSDFLENESDGARSRCSSDGESGVPDINHLPEKILFINHSVDQYERDLSSGVHSLLLSLSETDLHLDKEGPCSLSCIRKPLVKLLITSGYDAALCISNWRGSDRVPGGEHEYIDVIGGGKMGSERTIIDLDFRSHFEIARAVESYEVVLNSLPIIYVGSWAKLKQLLQVMAEAAKISLKQNAMPLPPWRSLAYLLAKWQSTYEIIQNLECENNERSSCEGAHCFGHLKRLKSSLQSEMEKEQLQKPITSDYSRRLKAERQRCSLQRL